MRFKKKEKVKKNFFSFQEKSRKGIYLREKAWGPVVMAALHRCLSLGRDGSSSTFQGEGRGLQASDCPQEP